MTLQLRIIAALVAFIVWVGAVGLWGERRYDAGVDDTRTVYKAAIDRQKIKAAETLTAETEAVHAYEAALQDAKNQQELKDATHKTTIADLSDRLRRAAGSAGRLRDPHAPGCGPSGGSAQSQAATAPGDSAADRAETGGLLSVPLSDLLGEILREADTINTAYASCRADATTIRPTP